MENIGVYVAFFMQKFLKFAVIGNNDYIFYWLFADIAYAKLAKLPYDMKREISNVYARIKAESNIIN